MIEQWVTEINPKAILRAADARCGARYAVYVVPAPGEFGTRCTDYLPLEQLEQYRASTRRVRYTLHGLPAAGAAGAVPVRRILCQ